MEIPGQRDQQKNQKQSPAWFLKMTLSKCLHFKTVLLLASKKPPRISCGLYLRLLMLTVNGSHEFLGWIVQKSERY